MKRAIGWTFIGTVLLGVGLLVLLQLVTLYVAIGMYVTGTD
jgi:hypothetical protein